MAGETDRLVQLCREAAPLYDPREYDVVVASGEQVTSGPARHHPAGHGLNARSYMGWQLPIRASGHGSAPDRRYRRRRARARVRRRAASPSSPASRASPSDGDVATLGPRRLGHVGGRAGGGVKADRCDIYTDVDGVYTTDPRIVPRARKLDMRHLRGDARAGRVGAKVLQTRSVGLAMRYNMPLQVLSSFEDRPGTMIVGDDRIEEFNMERSSSPASPTTRTRRRSR